MHEFETRGCQQINTPCLFFALSFLVYQSHCHFFWWFPGASFGLLYGLHVLAVEFHLLPTVLDDKIHVMLLAVINVNGLA